MDQFWQFAGNFWWLVFPLAGALAGAGKGIERALQRRHERRLEVMRTKAALAATTATRPVATIAEPKPITRPAPLPTQLEKLFATHDDVTARWLEYELDVAKLIAFPAMSDGRQPLTAAFLRAKKVADRLRPASVDAKVTPEQVSEYRTAVTDYEVTFEIAERDARRLRDSQFDPVERKRLATARQLLTVAVDDAATAAERQSAYKRARRELDGLIAVSDEAAEILEKKVALGLSAGATAAGATSAGATTTGDGAAPDDERGPAEAEPRP